MIGTGAGGCRSEQAPHEAVETTPAASSIAPPGIIVVSRDVEGGRHELGRLATQGGPVAPIEVSLEPGESIFVADTFDQPGSFLVLASRPGDREGKTVDRMGALKLTADAAPEVRWFGPREASIRNPVLSHDERSVVFESDAASFRDIYRTVIASDETQRLTDHEHGSFEPNWSPDDMQVVFVSSRDGNPEIYRVALYGGATRRLTEEPASDGAPVWAAASNRILFASRRDPARGRDLFSMRPDGTDIEPVLEARGDVLVDHLSLSPSGERIAFTEHARPAPDAAVRTRVVVFDLKAGTEVHRGDGATLDDWPTWGPDDRWLFFDRSAGEDSSRIVRLDLETGEKVELTDGEGVLWRPRWTASP